jgi:hypothetical protein
MRVKGAAMRVKGAAMRVYTRFFADQKKFHFKPFFFVIAQKYFFRGYIFLFLGQNMQKEYLLPTVKQVKGTI